MTGRGPGGPSPGRDPVGLARWRPRIRNHALAAVMMMAAMLGVTTTAAWAYWTSSGNGTGSATTATLNAPGTPAVTHTGGTESVGVSWTAPSGGVTPDGYYVTRIAEPGGAQAFACGTSTTVLVPSSCMDTAVPAGSYHYTVTAVYRSWTATSAPSSTVAVTTDVTAPVVSVTRVNVAIRTFPFASSAAVSTIGGECGMVPGDAATVAPLIDGAPTTPATAPCSAGAWTLTLTTPVTDEVSIDLSATQSDAAGNTGTAATQTVTIDTTRPTLLSIVRAGASPTVNAGPLSWTVTFSEPVSGVAASNFALVTSGLAGGTPTVASVTAATGPPPSSTWTVTAALNGATSAAGSIRLDLTSAGLVADAAGNTLLTTGLTGAAYGYDTMAPQVLGVTSTLANGSYTVGQVVPVTVTFSEPVIVGGAGAPELTLATGTPANTAASYTGGSGTATLAFTYTVAAGNTSADLDYASAAALALNGSTITDAATNGATLTLATPGSAGSLGASKALVIDTAAPVVTVTRVNGTVQVFPYITTGNVNSIGGACGSAAGDLAPVTVLVDGSTAGTVNCSGGAWTLPVSWTADGIRIVSATQADLATNTGTAPAQSVKVDKLAPTVIGVSSTVPDGSYREGQVIPVTVTFSEPVTVSGTPRLTLRTTPTPTTTNVNYSSGTGTNTLTFTYTVAAGHTSADLDYNATNSLSNGTIRDLANRNANRTLPAPGAPGSLAANRSIVIDTTLPVVSSVSATVPDGRYGIGAVIPVSVTFSEPVVVGGPGTPQLTLATGVPAATPVNLTSGSGTATLTFEYTVVAGNASADLAYSATNALALNGGSITDPAGNVATLTLPGLAAGTSLGGGKNLVIDTVIPTVTGVSSSLANGSYRAGQVVPVTVTFSEAVAVTGIPQLVLATGAPVTTAVNYTSGSGTAVLTFSHTVVAGNTSSDLDYGSTGALLGGGGIADLAGNPAVLTLAAPGAAGSLGGARNLVIDTTPPVVAVTHVNGSPRTFPYTTGANLVSFGGTCSTSPGDAGTVSPRINGGGTTPATAVCQPGGTWTLTLTAPLTTSGARTLSATQADLAGNIGTAPDQTVVLDTTPPTVDSIQRAGAPQLVNTGPLDWTVTFSEPVTGVAVGNFGFATSGLTGTPTVSGVAAVGPAPTATWTVTVDMGGVSGSDTASIGLNLTSPGSVLDAVGNALGAGTFTGQAYTYDTEAPTVAGVSTTLADGSYGAGQVVPVTVTFSEPVTVTGMPRLTLATGPSATTAVDYTSGSGSATLTFEYTVADGDNSADLDYATVGSLALNGGTIRDAAGNSGELALPTPGATGSLGDSKALVIDTTAPEVVVEDIGSFNFLGLYFLRVTGTAEVGSGPVTVHLCLNSGPTCDAGTATRTFTGVAVNASGAWQTNWTNMGAQGNWYASATQTDAAGNIGTSEVLGPIAN